MRVTGKYNNAFHQIDARGFMSLRMVGLLVFMIFHSAVSAASFQPISSDDQHSKDWLIAREHFHATWFEQADGEFKKLSQTKPDFALGYAYQAAIDMLLFRDTTANTRKAIKHIKSMNSAEAYMIYGLVAFANGNLEVALKNIELFLVQYPDDPFAQHMKGFLLFDLKRYEESAKSLQATVNSHPNAAYVRNHLGYALLRLEQITAAEKQHQLLIKAYPENPSVYDSYAETLLKQEKIEAAITQLKLGIELDDRFAYGWKHLAEIYQKNNQPELAKKAYQQALQSASLYGSDFKAMIKKRLSQ